MTSDEAGATGETVLLLIDLGRSQNRLGGSILAQVVSQTGEAPPDVDRPADLKNFWNAIQQLGREKKILAYHDRSDGGLLATLVEMAFAGHVGIDLDLPHLHEPFAALFNEELGAVIQVRAEDCDEVYLTLREHGLKACVSRIGALNSHFALRIRQSGQEIYNESLTTLRGSWSEVTHRLAQRRDNPAAADSEQQLRLDPTDPGITPKLTFALTDSLAAARPAPSRPSRRLNAGGRWGRARTAPGCPSPCPPRPSSPPAAPSPTARR